MLNNLNSERNMKTNDEILEQFTSCTIEEDADLDVKENFYYKYEDVIKAMNELRNPANGVEQSESTCNLQSVMQRVLKWWEKLPDNMNGDVSKYQYAYRHFERHWMSLTYREIEKIYGIEHVA